jgi:hypothetical protein
MRGLAQLQEPILVLVRLDASAAEVCIYAEKAPVSGSQ